MPNVINEEVVEVVAAVSSRPKCSTWCTSSITTGSLSVRLHLLRPETRTGTKKEVVYQTEVRTRPRTIVEYQNETRSRPKKVLSFKRRRADGDLSRCDLQAGKADQRGHLHGLRPRVADRNLTVTRCDQVPENKIENYTTRVCVPVTKEVEVQVCRMVPKVVSVTVQPCPAGCGESMMPAAGKERAATSRRRPQEGSLTTASSQPTAPRAAAVSDSRKTTI